jgi:transcriptional regulator with XRE-family HTH domain
VNREKIRAAIGDRKQRDVARAMGISEQYLSDILHGRRLVSVNAALEFERVLNLDALGLMYAQCIELIEMARTETRTT